MTPVSLVAPESIGTRDLVRTWLESAVADDLTSQTVEVDCGPLRAPTPSFFDELLKILVQERQASRVVFIHASDRAAKYAVQSARNREIEQNLQVIPTEPRRSRLLKSLNPLRQGA